MPLTSTGKVSNSGSKSFITTSYVNYGRIVGSLRPTDISYNNQQANSAPTVTINMYGTGVVEDTRFNTGVVFFNGRIC
jgi:hypothetical protein